VAEVVLRQVHDRSPQVGLERVGVPHELEPADEPQERLLHQVLG